VKGGRWFEGLAAGPGPQTPHPARAAAAVRREPDRDAIGVGIAVLHQRIGSARRLSIDQHGDADMAAGRVGWYEAIIRTQPEFADPRRDVTDRCDGAPAPLLGKAHGESYSADDL